MGFAAKQDQWDALNVSRETLDRLSLYADLLEKWQKKINLVGPKTIPDIWQRHFLDSAQLYSYLPADTKTLVDMGCGAGFPGLVLAIMGIEDVHLIDSDTRKMAFVCEAARVTETNVTVHACRIEAVDFTSKADVVSSRALASLDELLTPTKAFLKDDGCALFLKGRQFNDELDKAKQNWAFDVQTFDSLTDSSGQILKIERIKKK